MNSNIIGAIIIAAACIGAAYIFIRPAPEETKAALPAEQTCAAESGGCPIGERHVLAAESASGYDFTLEKLGGGTITLAEYRGEKPVILDFWASWCPNCRRDMPKVNRWYEQYQGQVEVIGINLQENPKTVEKFVQQNNIIFPIAFDPAGSVSATFGIQFTNTYFLFNKAGELIRVIPGDIKEEDVVSLLEI